MFFFVGSFTHEAGRVLQRGAVACPVCRAPADIAEVDRVLRVFFLPVWRKREKWPEVVCRSCGFQMPLPQYERLAQDAAAQRSLRQPPPPPSAPELSCPVCSAPLDFGFRYCPRCGAEIGATP